MLLIDKAPSGGFIICDPDEGRAILFACSSFAEAVEYLQSKLAPAVRGGRAIADFAAIVRGNRALQADKAFSPLAD